MVRGDRKVDEPNVLIHSDCRAMAIGARSQAARTYLEKFLNDLRVPSVPAEVHVSYNPSAGVRIGGAGEARPEGAEGHPAQ